MYLFWSNYIEPILKLVKPNVIVEVGAEHGQNSFNIVKYCRANGARCHVIDPLPVKKIEENREAFSKVGEYHRGLSLEVLAELESADAYLLDGDHNWFTVYNELKLIYMQAKESGQGLPICFFHDVSWPYARRDMYYDPDTIPEQYQNKFEKNGLRGNNNFDNVGINGDMNNAVKEGGSQNGVLTAAEDFVKEANGDYCLETVEGFHGLGILIPADLKDSTKEQILNCVNDIGAARKHIGLMETGRLETYSKINGFHSKFQNISRAHEVQQESLAALQKEKESWKRKYEVQKSELNKMSAELTKKTDENSQVKTELDNIELSRAYKYVHAYWRFKKKITGAK